MNYRKMGKHGLKLSELSLGSWVTFGGQVGEAVARDCMKVAYDAGVNFFDGAEVYSGGAAEKVMGKVLKREKWRREGLVLSTKIFWGGKGPNDVGLSHKHIIEGVHAALRRWQQDYLDLAFCHRPDPDTPIEETVRAFDILVKQGKIFYWGTSEWSAEDVFKAHDVAVKHGLTPPAMEQPQYNLLTRDRFEKEYAPLYEKLGYGTTIWSPLASGILTGKYAGGKMPKGSRLSIDQNAWLKDLVATPERIEAASRLEPLAKELGCTMAQLALAWCLKKPHVSTVILGASKPQQVKENLKALDVAAKLDDAWLQRIEKTLAG
ncbi:MAG: aldo/keto reductase [Archangiaceae bacterium]|nr:aldo/keto reductase [Archangiaceae bacterium]